MFSSHLDRYGVKTGQVGTVFHVGAGQGAELGGYLALNADQIVMVEADSQQAETLARKVQGMSHIKVLNKVVSSEGGKVDFYFTLPLQFSGLQEPTPFKNIFKNLSVARKGSVNSVKLDKLLTEIPMAECKKNVLVLQLNSSSIEVLSSLSVGDLGNFDVVVVQCIKDELIAISDGDVVGCRERCSAILENLFFKESEAIVEGPIYQDLIYTKDRLTLEIESLKQENSCLVMENNSLHTSVNELKAKAQQREAEFRQRLNKSQEETSILKAEIENFKSLNEQIVQKLTFHETRNTELEHDSEVLQSKNQRLTKTLTDLEGQKLKTEKLEKQRYQLENSLSDKISQFESIKKKVEQIESSNESLHAEMELLRTENVSLKNELEIHKEDKGRLEGILTREKESTASLQRSFNALNKQLEVAKSSIVEKDSAISLGQKMLAKAQLDLDSLRESYSVKVKSESELVDLVRELRDKLSVASQYYFKLQQDHPELLASDESIEAE